ncbi:MAG TPA: hypothetical protein VMU01_07910 [Rhizomicrobium sp.]|nr:hypothetical protein [Rhizomicrobium sp.]
MNRSSTIAAITALAVGLVALQYWNSARVKPGETELPALARDLPKDARAAGAAFRSRVARRFPAGTSGADMAKELTREGFRIGAGGDSASLKRTVFPCEIEWNVRWKTESGKIARTDASYALHCP